VKLVRDNIPQIIDDEGKSSEVEIRLILDPAEKIKYLRQKVIEEATEVAEAFSKANLIEEIADLREVCISLMEQEGITWSEVERARMAKKAEKGGFDMFYLFKIKD
jgi:predicted house-cleaning noncanonical NTP pyrophosphatase (MazG superfamily)